MLTFHKWILLMFVQQRYNLSDTDFTLAAFPEIPVGYDPEVDDEDNTQIFSPEDIVIVCHRHLRPLHNRSWLTDTAYRRPMQLNMFSIRRANDTASWR